MLNLEPLGLVFAPEYQKGWGLQLVRNVAQQAEGHIYLVGVRPTKPGTFEEKMIKVLMINENGFPIPGVPIAFSFSTADQYTIDDSFLWVPPFPQRAFIVATEGSGQIEQIQGSAVKEGQQGGVSVFALEPRYSSDVVVGAGMLGNHTGLHLTFKLQRNGVVSFADRLSNIEQRLDRLEGN